MTGVTADVGSRVTEDTSLLAVGELRVSFSLRRTSTEIVRRHTKRLVALDGISLELRPHETLGVVGESGSGKSTLAKAIVRLVRTEAGTIWYSGEDLLTLRGSRLAQARREIQLIYQDPYASLDPRLSIASAIAEPALTHGLVDRGAARSLADTLLERVGLPRSLADRRPGGLSGGQRQRVAIARSLAVQPRILIADEAVSALDVSVQAQMLNLFQELRADLGLSMLFISHQLGIVRHVADRVAVLYLGRVVETGPTNAVFASPAHPYTAGLLRAQPNRTRRAKSAPPALKGEIPSPLAIPSGCRFRTRCPLAAAICAEVDPPPIRLPSGQVGWCHFAAKVGGEDPGSRSATAVGWAGNGAGPGSGP
jgi:peptide/nickel transport system ATP-binding protein